MISFGTWNIDTLIEKYIEIVGAMTRRKIIVRAYRKISGWIKGRKNQIVQGLRIGTLTKLDREMRQTL